MRKILALSVTTALGALGMVAGLAPASTSGPDYLSVVSFKAVSQSKIAAKLAVTTKAPIPRHPNAFIRANPVVGFAWVDVATSKAFVTTIHPVLGRDSQQNPRAWHAHTVTLTSGATAPSRARRPNGRSQRPGTRVGAGIGSDPARGGAGCSAGP